MDLQRVTNCGHYSEHPQGQPRNKVLCEGFSFKAIPESEMIQEIGQGFHLYISWPSIGVV